MVKIDKKEIILNTNRDIALKEAYRVLKPGGKVMCLEFSKVENPFLKSLY